MTEERDRSIPRRQSPIYGRTDFAGGSSFESDGPELRDPPRTVRQQRTSVSGHRWRLHIILFLATVACTTYVGLYFAGTWLGALGYSAAIISILLCHEMGHFVLCLHYRVPATLPYFIPMPALPFGTMGAVIRMSGQLRSRQSILDIGAAGPIAGLVVAAPLLFWGLAHSNIVSEDLLGTRGGFRLGESLLFHLVARIAVGEIPEGSELILHPVAMAGWAGFFVTGLNLLPIGQLDGGHILYAVLGRRARLVGLVFLVLLGVLTLFWHRGWWPLLLLLLFFVRTGHPPPADPRPLDRGRVYLGLSMMVLFVLTFVPRPIEWVGP